MSQIWRAYDCCTYLLVRLLNSFIFIARQVFQLDISLSEKCQELGSQSHLSACVHLCPAISRHLFMEHPPIHPPIHPAPLNRAMGHLPQSPWSAPATHCHLCHLAAIADPVRWAFPCRPENSMKMLQKMYDIVLPSVLQTASNNAKASVYRVESLSHHHFISRSSNHSIVTTWHDHCSSGLDPHFWKAARCVCVCAGAMTPQPPRPSSVHQNHPRQRFSAIGWRCCLGLSFNEQGTWPTHSSHFIPIWRYMSY